MATTTTKKLSCNLKRKRITHPDYEVSVVCDDENVAATSCCLKRRKRVSKAQIRPWSELHADLIGELLSRLSSPHQIRFGAACRNFLSNLIPNEVQLPWLVKYDIERPSLSSKRVINCHLFDPRRKEEEEAYSVHNIAHKDGFSKHHTQLLACKGDWMFFSWPYRKQEEEEEEGNYFLKTLMNELGANANPSFVLFSPFTKQIVPLPDLDLTSVLATFAELDDHRELGAFSSHPSSPDCVYFLFRCYKFSRKVIISTYHQGDTDWTTQVFDHELRDPVYRSVVYHEGCFYCVSDDGNLGSYDVLQHEWRIVVNSRPLSPAPNRSTHLLVHQGQLLLACVDRPPLDNDDNHKKEKKKDECSVFEFDRSNTSWIKRESLGECALFLGCTSFSVLTTPRGSSRSMRSMREGDANKIFYVGNEKKLQCYSLKNGEFCESVYSCWPGTHSGIWIEPPRFMAKSF